MHPALRSSLNAFWKLPLYLAFAARKKQATWEQTERTP